MSKHSREKLVRGWLAYLVLLAWTALATAQGLKDCRIGYRQIGQLNASKNNAILFPTWFNGRSEQLVSMVGANKMLDPGQYFVVLIDALGNGVSSSQTVWPRQRIDFRA